ncbi:MULTISPECIES: AtpZ/AtpI family protein [Microcystis]|jgi:ATP synthase protein I|nr:MULTISPECIES: AtpZ/AtpI family protein [Microcystis]MDB9390701.1 AtpZ/AtpI family protein [Microcystis aeruginosa CS-579]
MGTNKMAARSHQKNRLRFSRKVGGQEERKLRARVEKKHSIWFGLGLLGLVGWSVVLPTLLGMALGIWIDREWPSRFSWTLMLMLAGLMLGCLNAGQWVKREQSAIEGAREQSKKELNHD